MSGSNTAQVTVMGTGCSTMRRCNRTPSLGGHDHSTRWLPLWQEIFATHWQFYWIRCPGSTNQRAGAGLRALAPISCRPVPDEPLMKALLSALGGSTAGTCAGAALADAPGAA